MLCAVARVPEERTRTGACLLAARLHCVPAGDAEPARRQERREDALPAAGSGAV